MAAIVEPGHCDPILVNNEDYTFIDCTGDTCTIGTSTGMTIPADVPIKQVLNGSMISPWVRLRFEGLGAAADWDYTEITTGNISQPCVNGDSPTCSPKCHASIKSFQFGWGTVNQGNRCKLTIVDEQGSSFNSWINRLDKNPSNSTTNNAQGVYNMKITFGWLVVGGDGNGCPAYVEEGASGVCNNTFPDYSSTPNTLLCSPPLWFIPNEITVNWTNGKFIYELEGIDTIFRVSEHSNANSFGQEATATSPTAGPVHFTDAVKALGVRSIPSFNVEFKQWPETGTLTTPEDLKFYVPNGVSINVPHTHTSGGACTIAAPCLDLKTSVPDLEAKGPISVYKCQGLNPMAAIQSWLPMAAAKSQFAGGRRGLTMNYDPIYRNLSAGANEIAKGRLIIWADSNPNCVSENIDFNGRILATYVVNGGAASPVFSFNPSIKWNFQSAVRAGGIIGPSSGNMSASRSNLNNNACNVSGTGNARNMATVPSGAAAQGENAVQETINNVAVHARANFQFQSIEAEMRVQGDPSYYLCSPIYGYGRNIAIVFINPFYIADNGSESCTGWSWSTLTNSACNDILTNKGWFIKGVEHQIKEGSFTTTYKLILFAPRAEVGGLADDGTAPTYLGLDASRSCKSLCNQATWTCGDEILVGSDFDSIVPGTNVFCDQACTPSDPETVT